MSPLTNPVRFILCVVRFGCLLGLDFRFSYGTFAHPISRHAVIFVGSMKGQHDSQTRIDIRMKRMLN